MEVNNIKEIIGVSNMKIHIDEDKKVEKLIFDTSFPLVEEIGDKNGNCVWMYSTAENFCYDKLFSKVLKLFK